MQNGKINGVNPYIGGIAGLLQNNSKIIDCHNEGNVESDAQTGGIVGYINGGEIINCSNSGNITGKKGAIMAQ